MPSSGALTQTTATDFSICSTLGDTAVTGQGNGAVQLAGSLADQFDGPALDSSRWLAGNWGRQL